MYKSYEFWWIPKSLFGIVQNTAWVTYEMGVGTYQ
jgi:hypothetical protein